EDSHLWGTSDSFSVLTCIKATPAPARHTKSVNPTMGEPGQSNVRHVSQRLLKPRRMPLVSITRLRVRRWRYLPLFLLYALASTHQARRAFGSLAVSLLNDSGFAFWTRTVWTDEAAMRAFMLSGAHRRVMPRLLDWCDEASVVHWAQDAAEPPPWP